MGKQIRAVAKPGTSVGQRRYKIFKKAYSRIKSARQDGYYLEAITLIESLLTDRLESRIGYLKKSAVTFQTLGGAIEELRKHESDAEFKELVVKKVDDWRALRNIALHQAAKLAVGDDREWEERAAFLNPAAKEGLKILREVAKIDKRLRKSSRS